MTHGGMSNDPRSAARTGVLVTVRAKGTFLRSHVYKVFPVNKFQINI